MLSKLRSGTKLLSKARYSAISGYTNVRRWSGVNKKQFKLKTTIDRQSFYRHQVFVRDPHQPSYQAYLCDDDNKPEDSFPDLTDASEARRCLLTTEASFLPTQIINLDVLPGVQQVPDYVLRETRKLLLRTSRYISDPECIADHEVVGLGFRHRKGYVKLAAYNTLIVHIRDLQNRDEFHRLVVVVQRRNLPHYPIGVGDGTLTKYFPPAEVDDYTTFIRKVKARYYFNSTNYENAYQAI